MTEILCIASRFEEEALSATRVSEEEEGGSLCSNADFTVQSSPHNLYMVKATTAASSQKKLQLDSDRCYRIWPTFETDKNNCRWSHLSMGIFTSVLSPWWH